MTPQQQALARAWKLHPKAGLALPGVVLIPLAIGVDQAAIVTSDADLHRYRFFVLGSRGTHMAIQHFATGN